MKHNGPLTGPPRRLHPPRAAADRGVRRTFPAALDRFASLEAQAAAISDDIAYNTHDLDDGLRRA